jgi:hypothetical protein
LKTQFFTRNRSKTITTAADRTVTTATTATTATTVKTAFDCQAGNENAPIQLGLVTACMLSL